MNSFVFNCPRCRVLHTTFNLAFAETRSRSNIGKSSFLGTVAGTCRNCGGGILIDVADSAHPKQSPEAFVFFDAFWWEPIRVFPSPNGSVVSEFLPPDVRQVMIEAEQALDGASPRIARGAFRTVLDVATKCVVSLDASLSRAWEETKPKNLYNRIEFLAERHILTPTLQDWAHGVRGITNEDVHTVEPVTLTEAQEIAEITRMILIYLFEMPERVKRAKETAKAKKEAAGERLLVTPAVQP